MVSFVVRLGIEPRLFCSRGRRVANYTIGQCGCKITTLTAKIQIYLAFSFGRLSLRVTTQLKTRFSAVES